MDRINGSFEVRKFFFIGVYVLICLAIISGLLLAFESYCNPYVVLLIVTVIIIFFAFLLNKYGLVTIDKKRRMIIRKGIFSIRLRKIRFDEIKIIKVIHKGMFDKCIYFITDNDIDEKKVKSTSIRSYIRVQFSKKIFDFIENCFENESSIMVE